jgi:hypothetical protein
MPIGKCARMIMIESGEIDMSDEIISQIVSVGAVLLGAIIGYVASSIQSGKEHQRQKERDVQKREWYIEDARRSHDLAIVTKRCDQAEEFVLAMAKDFNQFRMQSRNLIKTSPADVSEDEAFQLAHWQEDLDKNIFAYGPILRTLSNDEFDLTDPFQRMREVWEELTEVYEHVHETKVVKREEISNADEVGIKILDLYVAYNDALADFYTAINGIRKNAYSVNS